MAISDKYLPGNLNLKEFEELQRAEMDTVKGIPMEMFNRLSREEQERILGLGSEERTVKGIPMSIFNTLSPEDQRQILGLSGNLNKTEMDLALENLPISEQQRLAEARANASLTEQESSAGSFAEIKSLIGRLMAAGASRAEIMAAVQNLTRGNLNRAEIGKLIAAGAPRNETLPGNLNRTEMEMLNNSAPVSRFNQGGIVSLRHLTRPLGI